MSSKFVIDGDVSGGVQAVEQTKEAVQDLKQETKQANTVAKEYSVSAEELKDKLGELEKQADKTADAAKKTGDSDSLARWTTLFTGITAGVEITKKLSEGFSIAREKIKELADGGNVDMARLDASLNQVSESVDSFTQRLTNSQSGKSVAGFFSGWAESIAGGVEGIHELGSSVETVLASAVVSVREFLGTNAQEYRNYISKIQEQNRAADEAIRQKLEEQKIAKRTADAEKIEADLRKAREAERQQNAINKIASLQQVNSLVEKEIANLKTLAKESSDYEQKREAALKKIGSLEARRRQLETEAAAESKRKREEAAKHQEELVQKQKDREKELTAAHAKEQQKRVDDAKKAAEDRLQAERERLNAERKARDEQAAKEKAEREAKVAEVAKSMGGAAGNLLNPDQKQMAEQLANMRAMEARMEVLKKNAERIREINKALRETVGFEGPSKERFALEQERRGIMFRADSAGNDARKTGFRQAMTQFNGGREEFNKDELTGAVRQNAVQQIAALSKNTEVSKIAVEALAKAADEAIKTGQETEELKRQVEAINKVLGEASQAGNRRRGQTHGRQQR